MRSIIFTSLALLALPAGAVEISKGCFERNYSAAHLAKQPAQIVEAIRLWIYVNDYQETIADMTVQFGDRGRIRGTASAGQIMQQSLFCWQDSAAVGCSVECDGGWFNVTRDTGDVLTFRTEGLVVGDSEGCGGAESLAEVIGTPVSYRLTRGEDVCCGGN